jgi:hypothetical protein
MTCIECRGGTNRDGYSPLSYRGKKYLAHRFVWQAINGPIPSGLNVCHACDNPRCINIEHLFLGTQADNLRDMRQKGRHAHQKVTHCPKGHEYTPANTRLRCDGARSCRTCNNDIVRRRYHELRRQPAQPQGQ